MIQSRDSLISSSTSSAILTMSEKRKSTSPSATCRGKRIVEMCHSVRLAHGNLLSKHDNADNIKECAKCLDNIKCQQSETGSLCVCVCVCVCLARLSQSCRNETYQYPGMCVCYIFIALEINICIL